VRKSRSCTLTTRTGPVLAHAFSLIGMIR